MVTDLSQSSSDDGLDDGSSLFIQQMNLINNQQLDFLLHQPCLVTPAWTYRGKLPLPRWFPSNNIPFLGRSNDNLSFRDFLPCQLHISSQLPDLDPKPS